MDPKDKEYLDYLEEMNRKNQVTEEEFLSMRNMINALLTGQDKRTELV